MKQYVKCIDNQYYNDHLVIGNEYEVDKVFGTTTCIKNNPIQFQSKRFTKPYTKESEMNPQEEINDLRKKLQALEEKIQKNANPVLFTTEDGVDMRTGDPYWSIITSDINLQIYPHIANNISGKNLYNKAGSNKYFSTEAAAKEWLAKQSKVKELIIGSSNVKVRVEKNQLTVEGKQVSISALKTLIGFNRFGTTTIYAWDVDFDDKMRFIKIGCSNFSLNELQSVVDEYNKLNS